MVMMLDVDGWSHVCFSHALPNHHLVWEICSSFPQAEHLQRVAPSVEDCPVCFLTSGMNASTLKEGAT